MRTQTHAEGRPREVTGRRRHLQATRRGLRRGQRLDLDLDFQPFRRPGLHSVTAALASSHRRRRIPFSCVFTKEDPLPPTVRAPPSSPSLSETARPATSAVAAARGAGRGFEQLCRQFREVALELGCFLPAVEPKAKLSRRGFCRAGRCLPVSPGVIIDHDNSWGN